MHYCSVIRRMFFFCLRIEAYIMTHKLNIDTNCFSGVTKVTLNILNVPMFVSIVKKSLQSFLLFLFEKGLFV